MNTRQARPTPPKTPQAPADAATPDTLQNLRLHLAATRERLMLVNPDSLDDAAHDKWAEQLYTVSLAISKLRNQDLQTLADAFKQQLPALEASTARLAKDLAGMQQAVAVIDAVSQSLGIFTNILKLVS